MKRCARPSISSLVYVAHGCYNQNVAALARLSKYLYTPKARKSSPQCARLTAHTLCDTGIFAFNCLLLRRCGATSECETLYIKLHLSILVYKYMHSRPSQFRLIDAAARDHSTARRWPDVPFFYSVDDFFYFGRNCIMDRRGVRWFNWASFESNYLEVWL